MEAIAHNKNLNTLIFSHMVFNKDLYGKGIASVLGVSQNLNELEIQNVNFEHPRAFFEMCQPLLKKTSRISVLKIRGVLFTTLEVRVLQYILMNNKIIHTMDFSECIDDSRSNFEPFLGKFDKFSNVRTLTLDHMVPDLTNCIEDLGKALGENTKL